MDATNIVFIVMGVIAIVIWVLHRSGSEKCPQRGKRFSREVVGERRVPPRRGRPFQSRRIVYYYRCGSCGTPRGYEEKTEDESRF